MYKKIFFLLFCSYIISPAQSSGDVKFNNMTILVNSCDKYSDLWEPFHHFLFKNWPSLKTYNQHVPILFISNSDSYDNPRIKSVRIPNETSWSDTFLEALDQVETDYVLILLEDYIIAKPVNEARLQELFLGMQKAGAAYLQIGADNPIFTTGAWHSTIQGLRFAGKHDQWRISLQSCIWLKEDLKWILKKGEGIWDFEFFGSRRSEEMKKPFLKTMNNHPISYLNGAQEGYLSTNVMRWIHENGGTITATKLPLDEEQKMKFAIQRLKGVIYWEFYYPFKEFVKSIL